MKMATFVDKFYKSRKFIEERQGDDTNRLQDISPNLQEGCRAPLYLSSSIQIDRHPVKGEAT